MHVFFPESALCLTAFKCPISLRDLSQLFPKATDVLPWSSASDLSSQALCICSFPAVSRCCDTCHEFQHPQTWCMNSVAVGDEIFLLPFCVLQLVWVLHEKKQDSWRGKKVFIMHLCIGVSQKYEIWHGSQTTETSLSKIREGRGLECLGGSEERGVMGMWGKKM